MAEGIFREKLLCMRETDRAIKKRETDKTLWFPENSFSFGNIDIFWLTFIDILNTILLSSYMTDGERWERRLWRMKRPERVAAVEIL